MQADPWGAGRVNHYAVAYRSDQGPREELQDLPFCFRLAWTRAGYVPYDARPADHEDHPLDLTVAGILDGMGGPALPIDAGRLHDLASLGLEPGDLTPGYHNQPGRYLTGRGASAFLLASLRRHALRLDPELRPGHTGIAELLAAANRDMYDVNASLGQAGAGGQDEARTAGAAVTVCVVNAAGALQYANAGDSRAALIGSRPGTIRELSRKQTAASLDRHAAGTTAGQPADRVILNALGLTRDIEPHVVTGLWLPEKQVLAHLSDGAKEALMLDPELASIPWAERTLELVLGRLVARRLAGEERVFPLLAEVFRRRVLPHVAGPRSPRAENLVFDNVSMLMLRHASKLGAALDRLYQDIDSGRAALLSRSPFAIDVRELHARARAAGLRRPAELRALAELVESKGLRVRHTAGGWPASEQSRLAPESAEPPASSLPT